MYLNSSISYIKAFISYIGSFVHPNPESQSNEVTSRLKAKFYFAADFRLKGTRSQDLYKTVSVPSWTGERWM